MTAKIPTWKEINDPDFELPDEIEVRRSPIKLGVHFLFFQILLCVSLTFFCFSVFFLVIGDPRALKAIIGSVMFFVVFSPVWGFLLYLVYRYLTCRGPSFIFRRDGLYMGFIDGGYLVPWSQIAVVDYIGSFEIGVMKIIIYVDPDKVSGTPPFGRLGMRRGLIEGLKKRHLGVPLIYKMSSQKFKALMRTYKKAAEENAGHFAVARAASLLSSPLDAPSTRT